MGRPRLAIHRSVTKLVRMRPDQAAIQVRAAKRAKLTWSAWIMRAAERALGIEASR
jgi:hypothetical protein